MHASVIHFGNTADCESNYCPWMRFNRRKTTTGDLCSDLWSYFRILAPVLAPGGRLAQSGLAGTLLPGCQSYSRHAALASRLGLQGARAMAKSVRGLSARRPWQSSGQAPRSKRWNGWASVGGVACCMRLDENPRRARGAEPID